MKDKPLIAILIISFISAGLPAFAQEETPPLVTDRPDQTESSVTVPFRALQFEIGGIIERDKTDSWESSLSQYPGLLIRYGLFKSMELRFGGAYGASYREARTGVGEENIIGLNPLSAGFKVYISEEKGILPELSFIGGLVFPGTGHPDFELSTLSPSFIFAASHTLSDYLSLGWNLGAEWESYGPKANGIYSLVLGLSASDRIGVFMESYGRYARDEDPDHRMDAGITYLLSPNLQLDASAGMGITEAAPDFFISVGASFRIIK